MFEVRLPLVIGKYASVHILSEHFMVKVYLFG